MLKYKNGSTDLPPASSATDLQAGRKSYTTKKTIVYFLFIKVHLACRHRVAEFQNLPLHIVSEETITNFTGSDSGDICHA